MEDQPSSRPDEELDAETLRRIMLAAEWGFGPPQVLLAEELGMTVADLVEVQHRLEGVVEESEDNTD